MYARPKFLTKCEEWRRTFSIDSTDFVCRDVFDGKIWNDFQNVNGHPFLSAPHNFCFTLNVDWFQPFKRTTHSTGVMYIAIQNMPRKERYLCENVIVVGVIPGPVVGRSTYERSEWIKCSSPCCTYLCCLRYPRCQESLWICWA